jgi:hypothetical protein
MVSTETCDGETLRKHAAIRTEAIESEAEVSEKVPGNHVEWRGVSAMYCGGYLELGVGKGCMEPPRFVMAMAGLCCLSVGRSFLCF